MKNQRFYLNIFLSFLKKKFQTEGRTDRETNIFNYRVCFATNKSFTTKITFLFKKQEHQNCHMVESIFIQ